MIGYKVMQLSEDDKYLISGANSSLKFDAKLGLMNMPGNGIYMSPNKQYVLDYYRCHDNEALITFEFSEKYITSGNLEDRESEISVKQAKIIKIEKLED